MSDFLGGSAQVITIFSGFAAFAAAAFNYAMAKQAGTIETKLDNLERILDRLPVAIDNLGRTYETRMNSMSNRLNGMSSEIRGSLDTLTAAVVQLK